MEHNIPEVYSLMIPIVDQSILLPNATVAEIVPMTDLEHSTTGPKWFIGNLHWHGVQVPTISLDVINGVVSPELDKNTRVAIINTLNGNNDLPYIAIVVQGIPRLTHVTEPSISVEEGAELGEVDKLRVKIGSITAAIPDIDKLESMVVELS